jgi:hypothetical protein
MRTRIHKTPAGVVYVPLPDLKICCVGIVRAVIFVPPLATGRGEERETTPEVTEIPEARLAVVCAIVIVKSFCEKWLSPVMIYLYLQPL